MSDDAEALARKAAAVKAEGERRYGEHFSNSIAAVDRAVAAAPGLDASEVLRAALRQPDPPASIFSAGVELLANEASSGNGESEAQYSAWRAEQREKHLQAKGRMR